MNKLQYLIITTILYSFAGFAQLDANSAMGIPQVSNTTEMQNITGATEGSLVYNIAQKGIYVYNGTNWVSPSGSNWLIPGNNGISSSNFLGTTNDVKMEIRSNNLPMLEFGRRETLNLYQNFPDYTDNDQPLVHLKGNGNTAALQFAASGASFYKPMFFTTTNGSFRLKGSSGRTDLFEIGSGGPSNDGRLEFIIGDDGAEPIIFKRYDYRNGQFHKELFRVQGSNNTANAKTRFGININTNEVPVDSGYDDSQSGYNIANSTLQVQGSVATAITRVTGSGNYTLSEDNHTLIMLSNRSLTLPTASSCTSRVYIIKNNSGSSLTISSYNNQNNTSSTSITNNNTVWLQSDGVVWQQINN